MSRVSKNPEQTGCSTVQTSKDQKPTILVVDDDDKLRSAVSRALRLKGFRVTSARDGFHAMRTVRRKAPDLVLLDVNLPDFDGIEVMRRIREVDPGIALILFTGFGTVENAVDAMRLGAHDYLEKPVRPSQLLKVVEGVLSQVRSPHFAQLDESRPVLVGESRGIRRVHRAIVQAAEALKAPVLIQGESGTGKELVARAVHEVSRMRQGPFIGLNCAALTETLLETELFGYEKGSFTGAAPGGKQGLIAAAAGGILFLDEIGEMSSPLQAKLLRVLQERTFRPVGATVDLPMNCRIIASTNRVLATAVEEGEFRQDLFYRMNVLTIEVPPLRDRLEDIQPLTLYFFHRCLREVRKNLLGFSHAAMEALQDHDWPGNVRELKNVVEHAVLVCPGGEISPIHLGLQPGRNRPVGVRQLPVRSFQIRDMERELINVVIGETAGNVSKAARMLGINRSTLYAKMKEYGLSSRRP